MGKWSTLEIQTALPLEELSMRPSMPLVGNLLLVEATIRNFLARIPTRYDTLTLIDLTFLLLGATHEMMRADRKSYVKVLLENVQDGQKKNFQEQGLDYSSRSTPFDFDSIMMYGPTDFGIDDGAGQKMTTIQPLVPTIEFR